MRHKIDPAQKQFFDPGMDHLGRIGTRRVQEGWQGIFRSTLLELMPADEMGDVFSANTGRPTKELYAMAGLMVVIEMRGWTAEEAADAFMFDLSLQYALNQGHYRVDLSNRTVERYQRLFREKELAMEVFERVTKALVGKLELKIDQQRLDSTHLFSNMASFSRTQLMGVCVRRFMVQLKRHHDAEFRALDLVIRQRYAHDGKKLFSQTPSDRTSRDKLRQQVAEDLLMLMERFAAHAEIAKRSTYQNMVRVFHDQCEVIEQKVTIRKKTGGRVMQNPSDPDATYDGHKGPGYQIQLCETCHPENSAQLITGALPQTAADEDGDAITPVVEQLEKLAMKPTALLADTLYGSDDNQQYCEAKAIELVAPVRGPAPGESIEAKTDKHKRLAARRSQEKTEVWQQRYNRRSPIEGTNSGLKRRMDLGRLRVRGQKSVFNVLLLKVTGWNILRAVTGIALKDKTPESCLEMTVSIARMHVVESLQSTMSWLTQWFKWPRGRARPTVVLCSP